MSLFEKCSVCQWAGLPIWLEIRKKEDKTQNFWQLFVEPLWGGKEGVEFLVCREQSWQKCTATYTAAIANSEICCRFFSSPSSISYHGCSTTSNYFLRSSHRYAYLRCFLTLFHPKQAWLIYAARKTCMCLILPDALLWGKASQVGLDDLGGFF